MGVTLSLHLRKVICHVSHPDQVDTMGCSRKTLSVHKIDVRCLEAALTTPDILFIFNAMTVFFLETSCFKPLALMSVRNKVYSARILVEEILDYQSELPSKQLNFTPTCDSCDCGFSVHGLLLVSAYLWQLEPPLSLSLSHSLSLHVTFSFSICLFLYLPPSL